LERIRLTLCVSVDEFEAQLQTNTIGAVRCIKGALPHFRKNGAGTIVNVSSLAGFYGAPATTVYTASKYALSGFTEALATEVGVYGIRVILVEPGSFRTNLVTNGVVPARKIKEYDGTPARALVEYQRASDGQQPGDPIKGDKAIVDVATDAAGEVLAKKGKGEVLRVLLGSDCFGIAKQKLKKVEEQLDIIEEIAKSTDFA
jgi:NAD(P)-dependent dehydrogenase (short-subunit alcohol dehydrogenase family)